MSKTEENLKAAFAGESQANRKYLAFAKKAEDEGFKAVAKLFRAAAEAETVHAHNHLRELKGIGSTKENLREAIAGESHEFQIMYPAMIAEAKAEASKTAERSFHIANEVEKIHAALYQKALDASGTTPKPTTTSVKFAGTRQKVKRPKHVRSAAQRRWHSTRLIEVASGIE
jgi:rubrerythrin